MPVQGRIELNKNGLFMEYLQISKALNYDGILITMAAIADFDSIGHRLILMLLMTQILAADTGFLLTNNEQGKLLQ